MSTSCAKRPTSVERPAAFVQFLLLLLVLVLPALPGTAAAQTPADSAWNQGEWNRAADLYEERLAQDSSDVRALHRLALIRAWNEDYEASLNLFDRLLSLDSDNLHAQRDRGRVLSWADRLDASVALYDSLARANPGDRAARRGLARVLSWAGRTDSARALYDELLREDPDDRDAMEGLARVEAWRGNLREAEVLWRRSLSRDPRRSGARIGLVRTLRWQGRPAAAAAVLEEAPQSPEGGQRVELRRERAWIDAALSPFGHPGLRFEGDSDDNRILTARLSTGMRLAPRVELLADGYVRRARNESLRPGADDDRETAGASLAVGVQLPPGWWLRAGGGGTVADSGRRQETASWRAEIASPRQFPLRLNVQYRREALDATRQLVEEGVILHEVNLALAADVGSGWEIEGGLAPARFQGRGEDNDRLAGRLALLKSFGSHWTVGLSGRAFGFERDLGLGYFDPDFYGLGELLLRWRARPAAWHLHATLAPGVQQIGEEGDIDGAFRASGGVDFRIAPGRHLTVGGTFQSTGLQSFSTGEADYRYGRVDLGFRWAF